MILPYFFCEGRAETVRVRAAGEHSAAAAALKSITADEFRMLLRKIPKSRQIEAPRTAVIQRRRLPNKIFRAARDARPHDAFADIVTDMPAGVRQAVGMQARLAEQENAGRLQRGR